MVLKCWMMPAIGAVALGFIGVPAQAASAVTADLRIGAGQNLGGEQVHYRYHRRHHYNRYYRHSPGFYFYYSPWRHHRHHRYHRRHWRW
jgi:hypothetical protein